jgi:hypothetical protein
MGERQVCVRLQRRMRDALPSCTSKAGLVQYKAVEAAHVLITYFYLHWEQMYSFQ